MRRNGWQERGLVVLFVASLWLGPFGEAPARAAEDPFATAIRPTDPRSPDEERASFHLPPGFTIQLFAAEPEIQKPMNMAFDAKGRLWVSGSNEYPFPVPKDRKGRDSIRILEDRDGDGRADRVTTFADGLNIPIGLYPYKNGVIAFSIPNIEFFEDTDGDGHSDRREVLYGPLGYDRDTHGMNNAFRRGFDGWLYANHGWANVSSIRGRDGSRIDLRGGNTYRIRPDGSRVEHFTWGQVNPFGMTFDPLGDLFNADCHTKPIMLLLRDGRYVAWFSSDFDFARPRGATDIVPPVMEHYHGSTAIAGTTCYTGANFPPEYRGNMFVGNVMTSRVNRDSIRHRGATVQAIEEPDFVKSDDPWFRPVDLQVGPDGALYIADFYNKIIGHYEVPLTHPGRDRFRARIWRVVHVGDPDRPTPTTPSPDLRSSSAEQLAAAFKHPNLGVRMRAGDELVDRIGEKSAGPVRAVLHGDDATSRAHALWALHRLGAVRFDDLASAALDADRLVRIHAMRILSETFPGSVEIQSLILKGLRDPEPMVQRAAVDALTRHPRADDIDALFDLWHRTPESDVHLRHATKIALSKLIEGPGTLTRWRSSDHSPSDAELMTEIALSLPTEEAGAFLLDHFRRHAVRSKTLGRLLVHAARTLNKDSDLEALVAIARKNIADHLDVQRDMLFAIRDGLQRRGQAKSTLLRSWGDSLARELLASTDGNDEWFSIEDNECGGPAWHLETRESADNAPATSFLSSRPLGERYTGILRSKEFELPRKLSFFVCGHLGPFDAPVIPKNLVRLRLSGTGEVVAQVLAPRSDVAQKVSWDLSAQVGKTGYLEVVDGVDVRSFAWIAAARYDPPVVRVPKVGPDVVVSRLRTAAQIARTMDLRDLEPRLARLARAGSVDPETRASAARAVLSFHPDVRLAALVEIVADPALSAALRDGICQAAASPDAQPTREILTRAVHSVPQRLQEVLAERLSETREGGEQLLTMVGEGLITSRILQNDGIRARLASSRAADVEARIRQLTRSLPPLQDEVQRLIDARRSRYDRAKASTERGRAVFLKNCATCHQIGGQGALLGPQLDGIGNRGLERLVEDIHDPSRNVDPAFFTTLYVLKDGRVVSGLFRRQEGHTVIIADTNGKEASFPASEVEGQRKTRLSPMPANFGTALSDAEFYDLVTYLLAERH